MELIATRKEEQNTSVLDPWTAVHFAFGLALGLIEVRQRWAVTTSVAYELAEQYFERKKYGKDFFKTSGPEILPNAALDTAVLFVGHKLGQRWNRTGNAQHG